MKKITILVSLFIMVSYAAFADMVCGNTLCTGFPDMVVAYPDGGIAIYPTGGVLTGISCTPANNGKAIFLPDTNADGKKAMLSMLLMSVSMRKEIIIKHSGEGTDCGVNYIKFPD